MEIEKMRNKYNAKKINTEQFGKFDSKTEFLRFLYLKDLQDKGLITDLKRQVKYLLIPAQKKNKKVLYRECSYISDFEYNLQSGEHIVEDVKGLVLPVFKLKQKLMYWLYGIEVRVVKKW